MKPALLAAFLVTALLLSSCAAADPAENTDRPAGIAEAPTEETERVTEEEIMMFASMPENMRTVLF